ncbi:MAG TPA: ABC transporter ATP-binding protein [Anaerolineae bacterium]
MTRDAPNSNGFVIAVEDLWRIYKVGSQEIQALRGVQLHVEPGCFVALKGRSGSGKTTLLNCLGGLDRPDSGTLRVLGQELMKMDEVSLTRWRRDQVGLIFQSFGLLPTLSAYENVELMLRIKGAPMKERSERALACLEQVGLGKWMHHRPYEMSGGQQQRVAIARALANQPRLILADEPTGELDSTTGRDILSLFRRIVDNEHITLLMAVHDPAVDEFAHQVLHLTDGQIISALPGFQGSEDPMHRMGNE